MGASVGALNELHVVTIIGRCVVGQPDNVGAPVGVVFGSSVTRLPGKGVGSVNSASVCAPNSAPRLVQLTPDSASVHPLPSALRLLRLIKQTICGHSRPSNFKRPITQFVLTS